jgi:nicotinamide-nucleotide amidase
MLGVGSDTLGTHGAVSEPTVREMALGALERSHAQVAVAVSGTAGPSGGSPDKPVGTVCFAWAIEGQVESETCRFDGDRETVRRQSVAHALSGVRKLLSQQEK